MINFKRMSKLLVLPMVLFINNSCLTEPEEPTPPKADSISYLVSDYTIGTGEGVTTSLATVEGGHPFTFSIAAIHSNYNTHFEDVNAFTINTNNGVVMLADNNVLPMNIYELDIAVANVSGTSTFSSVLKFDIGSNVVGVYSLTSATLIDGDIANAATTDLVIENGGGAGVPAVIPSGETPTTTFFVNEILKGFAPCENQDLANWTYKIELKGDGTVAFFCTSEGDTTEDVGSWVLVNENKTLVLVIASSVLGQVVLSIDNLVVDSSTIVGTISAFPMTKNAAEPISPSNLQFMAFDIVLTK